MREQEILKAARMLVDDIFSESASIRKRLSQQFHPFLEKVDFSGLSLDAESVTAILTESDNFSNLRNAIRELDVILEERNFTGINQIIGENQFWSIGSIDLFFDYREIYSGYVAPVLRKNFVDVIPQRVVNFIITIDGYKDALKREYHDGVGWHYHYLDRHKRRSDVILAWDVRADGIHNPRALFSEKHAEGRRGFSGRPDLWGDVKRATMYDACEPDLRKWSIQSFRSPSRSASAVWPLGAVLTPPTLTVPPSFDVGSKGGPPRRR